MSPRATHVHLRILALLTCFSLVSYVERINISVAAKFMMPELGITQIQMGWIFTAFLIGYAVFQAPAGFLGDRWGPRRVLTIAVLIWGITTILTGLLPGLIVGAGLASIIVLIVIRATLGIAQAATFPVMSVAIARWFPTRKLGTANGFALAGMSLGAAFTPPLVAWAMVNLGWRQSFYITSILAFGLAAVWWWYARDRPADHTGVSPEELAEITFEQGPPLAPVDRRMVLRLLRNREVLLLTLSYTCLGYLFTIFVFWLYTYLVDVRQFSVLRGGVFTSLPFFVAVFMVPLGGKASDLAVQRYGRRVGRRLVPIISMLLAAILVVLGVQLRDPYVAIICLALCFGFLESTEGAFWSSTLDVAGSAAGTATGILNMGGNLGGVLSTAFIPVVVAWVGWPVAVGGAGAVVSVLGALLWLGIRADRVLEPESPGSLSVDAAMPISASTSN